MEGLVQIIFSSIRGTVCWEMFYFIVTGHLSQTRHCVKWISVFSLAKTLWYTFEKEACLMSVYAQTNPY